VLLLNQNQKFICKNIHLKTVTNQSDITRSLKNGQVLKIPIAHADGRYFASPDVIDELKENDQIIFAYCDEMGEETLQANVNGSSNSIAGICNRERNVYGMMPHPERAAEDELGNVDGKLIFDSLLQHELMAI
jgi:phosphoribosylformylglycinamidine synthase